MLILTLPALLTSEFGASAADTTLAAVLARIDETAAKFKGLSADVKKVSYTAVINEETTDTGTVLVRRPKANDLRVRMDILQPDPKTVVIEGHKADIYYPRSGEVQVVDLGKQSSLVDQFLVLGFGSNSRELASAYSIRMVGPEAAAGEKTTRLELIPKDQDVLAHLKKVELWISDGKGIAVQQKFYEPGGDFILATYTNIQMNPSISDSAFNLPKGAHKASKKKPELDHK
ncbi:MAG: outer membrane lipoprotein carrier protein LolA [Acidobacteriia bacterium]|nr:outer membrane lipoprotein carrier protein LolA [Terriglobia bacterium]